MKSVTVNIYDVEMDGLPDHNCMILADDGQEWHILVYDQSGAAYAWEYDEPVQFERWAYLSELISAEPANETDHLSAEDQVLVAHPVMCPTS